MVFSDLTQQSVDIVVREILPATLLKGLWNLVESAEL
jgi:hypothetical protein